MKGVDRGLDLARVASTTDAEKTNFKKFYATTLGRSHPGLDFWLAPSPEVLKLYRAFAVAGTPETLVGHNKSFTGFGFVQYYALLGYVEGIRYIVFMWQTQGLTKAQVLEGLALAFIHSGPRGMETVAEALDGYEWITPDVPAKFPAGWARDPDAFRSGLDFTTTEMSGSEAEQLRSWYQRTLGEVPPYVTYLSKYRPAALKAYRARFETCIETLPKQVVPYTMLHYNTIRAFGDGIRENVLLAKAWGMTKDQTLRPIYSALLNAGVETISLVDRVAGDVFKRWT